MPAFTSVANRLMTIWKNGFTASAVITVLTIIMEGDANGAPHPDASSYAKKVSGQYAHRLVKGDNGHSLFAAQLGDVCYRLNIQKRTETSSWVPLLDMFVIIQIGNNQTNEERRVPYLVENWITTG
jgi:hypothetical protein